MFRLVQHLSSYLFEMADEDVGHALISCGHMAVHAEEGLLRVKGLHGRLAISHVVNAGN